MKATVLFLLLGLSAVASDITFTNKTLTFTNLQGAIYTNVTLLRADLDGLIWRDGPSGGRVCYTNLSPEFLVALGIPTNRIATARLRAERKTLENAQSLAALSALAAMQEQLKKAKQETNEKLKQRAEMIAEALRIEALRRQIVFAKAEIRRGQANAHDYNMANWNNPYAGVAYVPEGAKFTVEQAEEQLSSMQDQFREKYGTDHDPKVIAEGAIKNR